MRTYWIPRSVASVGMLLAVALLIAPRPLQAADQAAVERILNPIIGVHAEIPETARTAAALGTERDGSGVVIDDAGLVLTIGYVILEADRVEVRTDDGTLAADIVAYDHESGFGLLRAERPIDVTPMPLGDSEALETGTPVLAVSWQDGHAVTPTRIVSRRLFAGYWEYLLADAIFTQPPHPGYGGAALVSADGRLVGIGSLLVNDAVDGEDNAVGNMFVPVEALKPILGDLVADGRRAEPPPPWLGLFAREAQGRVFVTRVADEGPASTAGIKPGDVIIGVDGERVGDLPDFYRRVRALGTAGTAVPLDVVRRDAAELAIERIDVTSADRSAWLKLRQAGE